jgi:hypothetical protein
LPDECDRRSDFLLSARFRRVGVEAPGRIPGSNRRSRLIASLWRFMGRGSMIPRVALLLDFPKHSKTVFHWSFALRLRSRIARRSHFIAVRLSGLITAAHKRTHPIALSYLSGALRFIAFPFPSVPFSFATSFVSRDGSGPRRTREAFITTLLRATRTLIAVNPRIFSHCPLSFPTR